MNLSFLKVLSMIVAAYWITSCTSTKISEKQLTQAIEKNPELFFQLIEKHPDKFMRSMQIALDKQRQQQSSHRREKRDQEIQEAIQNPYEPKLKGEFSMGPKNAPIHIVEYSDFQCGFCARAQATIEQLKDKYPGKIRYTFKHLPLNFHPHAKISALYFEAIALQSKAKALDFKSRLFSHQLQLKEGEKFLKKVAKTLKVDFSRLQKDLLKPELEAKIDDNIQEAKQFGMRGTPGFLVNGVPVRGAFPAEHFEYIIEQLKSKQKIRL